jgi:hypothetical protein
VPAYALVAIVAVWPDLVPTWLGLQPLQVEALLPVVILLFGMLLAWLAFTEQPGEPQAP